MSAPVTPAAPAQVGVREVRIAGFRSARSVTFSPGPVCALVGGPSVGKSNLLAAIWTLLDHRAPAPDDLNASGAAEIRLSATLAGGAEIELNAAPPGTASGSGAPVPTLFLPASLRSGTLAATAHTDVARAIAESYFGGAVDGSSAAPATAFVDALERLVAAGVQGLVLLIEEPELFLRPQTQRYLYRLLRTFAAAGNQVLYSTHEPAFLNVGRLDEVALVEHRAQAGTSVIQPTPLDADESFRALSELDAERAELFLAAAVLLVEGRTEKLTLPFVFGALGYDADREGVTILDCGGKPNMPLFIRICRAARKPCVVIHDRDAPPGRKPAHSERQLNAEIAELAGPHHTVVLAPDFEAVARLRGHHHKPAHAWQLFSSVKRDGVPQPLIDAVERVVRLARA